MAHLRLCAPLSDAFRRHSDALLPLVAAVGFKAPSDERFGGKTQFLECSTSIADSQLPERLADAGYLAALASGRFHSFACDLGPAWSEYGLAQSAAGFPRYVPVSGRLDEATYLRQAKRNVAFLRGRFGGSLKIENLNYFQTGAYDMVCEPSFITRIVEDLGLELLFDVSHAMISAANLGVPIVSYVDALPLGRATELHVSATRRINGVIEDAHDMPGAHEYVLVEHVGRTPLDRFLTIEHYRDGPALVAEYHRLVAANQGSA
ncbi:MAG: DUF692 family protein [Vicinamibacterales bacterium]|jgi:hypothetical protein|nr:DUF692 family protein [Vicinamibacterales bacterium]